MNNPLPVKFCFSSKHALAKNTIAKAISTPFHVDLQIDREESEWVLKDDLRLL
jgi:hypothetical protein